ncbi:MAG: HAMP domain-containing histidine kinase, partial [Deltaproteobacteria bacterium]|nr:HAMP domain-containing histidine kinase [Deltaproteobacteria bacterium]
VKHISGRIRKTVFDILFYSKERELKKETVNVLDFANEVADVIEPKIKDRSMVFNRDFDEAPEEFEVDADFLRSALINILDNAVDACLEDEDKDMHRITFGINQDKNNTVINISDDGIGMDDDTIENLFKLFFSSKGGKGTGFGLFISDNIIKQHGGTINVNSVKRKGSVFTIKIPNICQKSED